MGDGPTNIGVRTLKKRVRPQALREITERQQFREMLSGIAFITPYAIAFGVFLLYPMIKGLYMSTFDWNPVFPSESEFIGLKNYELLFGSSTFYTAVVNTAVYSALFVPTMVITSLMMALGVNRDVRGKWLLRLIFFSPGVLTISVIGLIWIQLFAPSYGAINQYLIDIGIRHPPNWLNSHTFALPAIVITAVWAGVGFNFIIFLAARKNVPDRLYEAATLDGAGPWRMLRDITIPQMRPAIIFVSITSLVGSFQVFDLIYIMTGGGPGNETLTIVMFLYNRAFASHDFGYAAAIGYVLFGMLLVVSAFNYFVIDKYTARVEGETITEDDNE